MYLRKAIKPMFSDISGFQSGFKTGFVIGKMVLIWFFQQLELVFQPSKKLATLRCTVDLFCTITQYYFLQMNQLTIQDNEQNKLILISFSLLILSYCQSHFKPQ
jgi:hypothetical protein